MKKENNKNEFIESLVCGLLDNVTTKLTFSKEQFSVQQAPLVSRRKQEILLLSRYIFEGKRTEYSKLFITFKLGTSLQTRKMTFVKIFTLSEKMFIGYGSTNRHSFLTLSRIMPTGADRDKDFHPWPIFLFDDAGKLCDTFPEGRELDQLIADNGSLHKNVFNEIFKYRSLAGKGAVLLAHERKLQAIIASAKLAAIKKEVAQKKQTVPFNMDSYIIKEPSGDLIAVIINFMKKLNKKGSNALDWYSNWRVFRPIHEAFDSRTYRNN